jgi:hypothetical protein
LWGIPPLVLVWSNLHHSAYLVWVFGGLVLLGLVLSQLGRGFAEIRARFREGSALLFSTLVASLSCPHPWDRLHTAWSTVFMRGYTVGVLSEWKAPTLAVWLGPTGVFLALVALGMVIRWRHVKLHELLVSAVALWMGARHIRFLPIVAVVTGPIGYRHWAAIARPRLASAAWRIADRGFAVTLVLGVAIGSLGLDSHSPWLGGFGRPKPQLVGQSYPEEATRFLARERPQGNLYNTFHFGGYLIYHLAPELKVFVDGRTGNLYDDAHVRDVVQIRSTWPQVFARWNIQSAITQYDELEVPLANDPHWCLVFFDDAALVFVRQDGPNAELARRLGYVELRPPFAHPPEGDPVRMARLEAEIERAVAEAPGSALAHILRGRIRAWHRDLAGFEREMQTALRLDPRRTEPWQRLGLWALSQGDYGRAIHHLETAVALSPQLENIHKALARAYLGVGNAVAAREQLRAVTRDERHLAELFESIAASGQRDDD